MDFEYNIQHVPDARNSNVWQEVRDIILQSDRDIPRR